MRGITRLMCLTGRSSVTLATSDSDGAGFTPRRTSSKAPERLTMTYSIARRRGSRAALVAVPVVAGMLLTACGGSGDSGKDAAEPQTITFTYAPANPEDT